ncbi:ATP-grasp domain-containing protein [Verminephrobacter aporrectodeae subsp. tuberculatae]|uniref:ATP-binding protein n=1 Tax=Verminephrobacter aporrectodeae TaxID=1110389 RepID=UPI0022371A0D|nr:biotin carboxylase N-terminal domain-containing protein [Verminephrobacter aporrectodeae]MCW5254849.1 ATP-grasp domain-containing protein [Verminephrobacter aporrectodeae subsp. tuberculatae]
MKKILIANRGEIARRVIHTAHAMGIASVAVYSDPDARALHVREATQSHALGGTTSADSYLRIDKLLAAAQATGADAVHPGYGFLSENADFAQAVLDAGLTWIGPPPAAMRALGDKAHAKALALAQGLPCLPGYAGDEQSAARFGAEAERIGYPVMVKAIAGGGGRGMRLVTDPEQLPAALVAARSEALAGFGCGDLLIERALSAPRHVELQLFADTHGACIHLGERDCSVQRRYQKLIEESPCPALSTALRTRLGDCAVALARAAGYVGAGTVEFLVDGDAFYLMEMNPRLQVEHPVTEAVTGFDLVQWQIRVARGEPLPIAQHALALRGHAIEVRLCAEDTHFRPHTGRVLHFAAPQASAFAPAPLGGLRLDHALEPGGEVTADYDALLGKLIVHAATREQAIATLLRALRAITLLGLPNNRAFLVACLEHPVFRAGQALLPFLTEHAHALRERLVEEERALLYPAALCAVYPAAPTSTPALPCGFARPLRLRHQGEILPLAVRARVQGGMHVDLPGGEVADVRLVALPDGSRRCNWSGVEYLVRVVPVGERRWHWQIAGVDGWVDDASLEPSGHTVAAGGATELRAPFNGRVLALAAEIGQVLAAGDTVLVIESMKLEHQLACPAAARLAELFVSPGQQVAPGQVLARLVPPAAQPDPT